MIGSFDFWFMGLLVLEIRVVLVALSGLAAAGMLAVRFTKKLPASSFEDPGRLASRSVAFLAHSPFQSRADGAQVHTHAHGHGRSSGFPLVQHRRQYQGAKVGMSMVLVGALRAKPTFSLYDIVLFCHN
jgi:hypothetical protein